MRKGAQLSFPTLREYLRTSHGGTLRSGKRKLRRPLDPRRPTHVVLRAEQARGPWSLLSPRNKGKTRFLIEWSGHRFNVRVHRFSNVGNHLHLVVSFKRRVDFQRFLKTLTGLVARAVTGARKGRPLKKRFWDLLAFTRVAHWGQDYFGLRDYLRINDLEASGIPRPRLIRVAIRP